MLTNRWLPVEKLAESRDFLCALRYSEQNLGALVPEHGIVGTSGTTRAVVQNSSRDVCHAAETGSLHDLGLTESKFRHPGVLH